MYKSSLLAFGLKSIISLSFLLMLSSQIQAEERERAPVEKPSPAEVKKQEIKISVPEGSSARDIERAIQKSLERNNYKPNDNERREIKSKASKAAEGLEKAGIVVIYLRCCIIIIIFK